MTLSEFVDLRLRGKLVPCFVLKFICVDKSCLFYRSMSEYGEKKYGNCLLRLAIHPQTLNEISRVLDVSSEAVRQVVSRALRRLALNSVALSPSVSNLAREVFGYSKVNKEGNLFVKADDDLLLELVELDKREILCKEVICPKFKQSVKRVTCLLCPYRAECKAVDPEFRAADPTTYFSEKISNFDDLIRILSAKVKNVTPQLFQSAKTDKSGKKKEIEKLIAQSIVEGRGVPPLEEVAKQVGVSGVYVRKVVKDLGLS